ncbi:MAG TPA: ABC transporter substrate-binding protein [Casimicrobiaceae bacterium]|nr:ABC transporter substrate-binding protein [Casimicrobiaceae bacterium]
MKASMRLCVLFAAWLALAAAAQAPQKTVRIGYLTAVAQPHREAVFREALAKHGWVERRNLAIEYRSAEGSFDKLPALADELVRLRVDVIVTFVTQASLAAKNATATIPIVVIGVSDPVKSKLVRSLARPDGNVTGNSITGLDVIGKQFELLRELKPGIARVALLSNPGNQVYHAQQLAEAKSVAARLGITVTIAEASQSEALDEAFRSIARAKPGALLIFGDPMFGQNTERIARNAIAHALPAVGPFPPYAEAGVLAAYGASFDDMFRQAAIYVDRILKGAKPADLPIEQATRYELIVNLKTAKALGITVPPSLVSRADRVIH